MINNLCQKYNLEEGKDFFIQQKGVLTFLYFNKLSDAETLRNDISRHAILRNFSLSVISDIIHKQDPFSYYFFVSQERII
ncbi:hypothetical protein PZB74_18825 [Porifericola rhodea]|uniref:hypothetical protein n=1 Tax=Porifericola rhodea TaxID=930972 RepID=UPI0026663297|nr:hypothetical protein [Porifericola rhodea]WKN31006.1 hypothetical protein PZB74_18825 [Porifericola rhodea]